MTSSRGPSTQAEAEPGGSRDAARRPAPAPAHGDAGQRRQDARPVAPSRRARRGRRRSRSADAPSRRPSPSAPRAAPRRARRPDRRWPRASPMQHAPRAARERPARCPPGCEPRVRGAEATQLAAGGRRVRPPRTPPSVAMPRSRQTSPTVRGPTPGMASSSSSVGGTSSRRASRYAMRPLATSSPRRSLMLGPTPRSSSGRPARTSAATSSGLRATDSAARR